MYESERLQEGASGGGDRTRLSSYLSLSAQRGNLSLTSVSYAQPRTDKFSDIRAIHQTTLAVSVNTRFALTLNFDLSFDSEPPPGVKELDSQTSLGLKASW